MTNAADVMNEEAAKQYLFEKFTNYSKEIQFVKWIDDMTMECKFNDETLQIYFGNKIKEYRMSNNIDILDEYVKKSLYRTKIEASNMQYVLGHLRIMIQPADLKINDIVRTQYSENTQIVAVYYDEINGGMHFISKDDLKVLGKTEAEILSIGKKGIDEELTNATLKEAATEWGSYYYFETKREHFKASYILGDTFIDRIKSVASDPYVLVSNRDCLYITDKNNSILVNKISGICIEDYNNAGYPITTEVFGIENGTMTVVGRYK